jgi:hypothetical protein
METPARKSFPVWFLAALLAATALAGLAGRYLAPRTVTVTRIQPPVVRSVAQGESIAAALAMARPGDTVEVAGGEYHEEVKLKDGVTVRSRVPRDANTAAHGGDH